ncbi:MAG TPA: hypothetical protein VGN26_07045 [Armatimonadota bacterium]|jgi:hypothetical protein
MRLHERRLLAVLTGTVVAMGACAALAAPGPVRTVALESGTVIPARLQTSLSSKDAIVGDKVVAKIDNKGSSYLGIPSGSTVEGVVTRARAKEGKNPGVLGIGFRHLRLPDGRAVSIDGAPIGLDSKSVETRSDGRLVAKANAKKTHYEYIGYGAGAGAVLGLLTGGKLKLSNVLIGAAAGYGASQLLKSGKKVRDVELKSGTELGVRIDKGVKVTNIRTAAYK